MIGLPVLEDLLPLEGRRVLVRVDFNVPLHTGSDGTVTIEDDFRILQAVPTLTWLVEQGVHVVACTHLGRPHGMPDDRYRVEPVRVRLGELVPGVELMENLRFDPGEEANDPAFVDRLCAGFDCYVNDAFGVSHRAHASVVGPPTRLPSAAGRLLHREAEVLSGLLHNPARPFVAVVGGGKVADKLGVLRALAPKVDQLVVGGGMAFTFLVAEGYHVGGSLLDESSIDACRELLSSSTEILLPSDFLALGPDDAIREVGDEIPDGFAGLDIGPKSAAAFAEAVASAKTVLWNGPMGVFEDPRFAAGTTAVARAIAASPAFSVVGGGDSVSAVDHLGLAPEIDHVSTGGGASLEFIEYGDLPGLAALRAAPRRRSAPVSGARGVLVSGNWKMNENHYEALKLVTELSALLRANPMPEDRELALHPSFTSLRTVGTALETDRVPVALGAQNCHFEDAGAYTGEVSAPMLAKLGVTSVICGHSERRNLFGETDEIVAKKADAILRAGMSPLVCVGESAAAREAGEAEATVSRQLAAVFSGGRSALASRFVVAYEPIWAIGAGTPATPKDAELMCAHIHAELERLCGASAASVRVQYGGSVSEENAAELLSGESVDGLLVGGASLDAARFVAIARAGA